MMKPECSKTKYASQSVADFDIKKIAKKSKRGSIPIRSYLCHCGSWHLTSKKDFNVEIKQLKDEILILKKENDALKKENEFLKDDHYKSRNHEIQIDKRVQQIQGDLRQIEKRYINLKKENSELISTLVKLQKK